MVVLSNPRPQSHAMCAGRWLLRLVVPSHQNGQRREGGWNSKVCADCFGRLGVLCIELVDDYLQDGKNLRKILLLTNSLCSADMRHGTGSLVPIRKIGKSTICSLYE